MTCDGPLGWISSEDINTKMRACGWEVIDVADGRYNVDAIVAALDLAKHSRGKPVFLNIVTVIGIGTAAAGTAKAHHGGFDPESIDQSKALAGLPASSKHVVPEDVLQYFRERRLHGAAVQRQWRILLQEYSRDYPEEAAALVARMAGSLGDTQSILDGIDSKRFSGMATRQINGALLQELWAACPALCGGGADLVNANKISYDEADVFGPQSDYKGRYLRNGIREHAMASIANGIAAYNPQTFLPITATFFMFYIYVRMSDTLPGRRETYHSDR